MPLNALNYLTAECNYGGRITDNFDRRLVGSLLESFFCSEILEQDSYKYCAQAEYYVPSFNEHEAYLEYIRNLPHVESPEIFGLHENANTFRNYQESQHLIDSILLTLPKKVVQQFFIIS